LKVSQQHRMLLSDWRAEIMFGEAEVLAPAKHLINNDRIYIAEQDEVTYHHILFDAHEIVYANGAASESFHPGDAALNALDKAARDEVLVLFPELAEAPPPMARTVLKSYETAALVA
ncbi:MAG: Hint domain-containing protein, partial [Pseudomonadota bacterium]